MSRLLACLHPNPLTDEEIEMGFEMLLDLVDDLVIDIPDAKMSFPLLIAASILQQESSPSKTS